MNHKQEPHKPIPFEDALQRMFKAPTAAKAKPATKQGKTKDKKKSGNANS